MKKRITLMAMFILLLFTTKVQAVEHFAGADFSYPQRFSNEGFTHPVFMLVNPSLFYRVEMGASAIELNVGAGMYNYDDLFGEWKGRKGKVGDNMSMIYGYSKIDLKGYYYLVDNYPFRLAPSLGLSALFYTDEHRPFTPGEWDQDEDWSAVKQIDQGKKLGVMGAYMMDVKVTSRMYITHKAGYYYYPTAHERKKHHLHLSLGLAFHMWQR